MTPETVRLRAEILARMHHIARDRRRYSMVHLGISAFLKARVRASRRDVHAVDHHYFKAPAALDGYWAPRPFVIDPPDHMIETHAQGERVVREERSRIAAAAGVPEEFVMREEDIASLLSTYILSLIEAGPDWKFSDPGPELPF